jgi:peptide/nickel transport system substrate-binding protein
MGEPSCRGHRGPRQRTKKPFGVRSSRSHTWRLAGRRSASNRLPRRLRDREQHPLTPFLTTGQLRPGQAQVAFVDDSVYDRLMKPIETYRQDQSSSVFATDLTRRRLLEGVGLVGAGAVAAGILAGCGGSTSSATAGAVTTAAHGAASGLPSRGGVLRLAAPGNGASETYNPALMASGIDFIHGYSVFDPLIRTGPNYSTSPGLALEWTPNADNTVWEIKLRQGVSWQDGKPFTADDVIYTLRGMGSPAHFGHSAVVNVRLAELKKLGDYIVRVPLYSANNRLFDQFIYGNMALVIQDGTKLFSRPVGTGPYKLQSFVPGQHSVLTANRDYWDDPYPYPDQFEILSIDDETARVNALQSGAVDMAYQWPFADAKAAVSSPPSGYSILLSAPGDPNTFYMRVDKAPFSDNRVRTAIKLSMNRPGLIDAAFSGIGTVANDILGMGVPLYDNSLPQRKQDIEQAKSLLKAAGQSDLRITLTTSPAWPGMVEAATAYVQQAAQAGITVRLTTVQPANYFNPGTGYLSWVFAQSSWPTPSLQSYYGQALLSSSPLNETHFKDPAFDQLYTRALGTNSPEEQQSLWNELQTIQYNEGGNIAWVNQQSATGYRPNVRGLNLTGSGSGWMNQLCDFSVWKWGLA